MADWTEEIVHVAETDIAIIKGGSGKPLLVLHEELGHPGWLGWHRALARERQLIIPISRVWESRRGSIGSAVSANSECSTTGCCGI